jgi:hypothetical protein
MLLSPPTIQKLLVKETENMLKYVSKANSMNLSRLVNSAYYSLLEFYEKS